MDSGLIAGGMTISMTTLPHRTWVALYATVAALYLLTDSGRLGANDALAMFNVAQSLATRGSISADPCTPDPRSPHCVPGVDGQNYAGFGLAPSIVAVPAYAASEVAASVLHRDVRILGGLGVALGQALWTAAVPLVLGLWLARIGLGSQAIIWGALVYAFASPAWYFSKSFYSEPYFALGLIGCCYFLCCDDRAFSLAAAGASFGFAVGSRVFGLILAPAIVLYGVLLWRSRNKGLSEIVRNLLVFGAPVAVSVGLIAWSNQLRFGSVLKTGYHLCFPTTADLLSTPLLVGMKNLLISNEVGVLIFVPWVVMVPFLWRRFWSRSRNEAVLVLGMVLINYLFFAKYEGWHGGWCVGPRMLNAVFPFLILPVALVFDKGAESLRSWAGRMTVALIGLACLIQVLLIPYPGSRYYTMEAYNHQHSINPLWNGKPLIEAVAALPELLFGAGNQNPSPAHQYLLTFPNSVNQIRADLWLLKAPLFGLPHSVAYLLAALLLILFVLGMRAVLAQVSCRAKLQGERPAQDLDPTPAPGV